MYGHVKDKLIAALRSGEYEQAKGLLRIGTEEASRFCCLGVLCDLYAKETGDTVWTKQANDTRAWAFLGRIANLPHTVSDWAGMSSQDGQLSHFGSLTTLAQMNDTGTSFNLIADAIELNWTTL